MGGRCRECAREKLRKREQTAKALKRENCVKWQ